MEPSDFPNEQPIPNAFPEVELAPEEQLEEDLAAFVGPRADYYLRKWRPVLEGRSSSAGFNVAAFLLAGVWLSYRKMYRVAFLFYALILGETLLEEAIFRWVLAMPEAPWCFSSLVGLIAGIIVGALANKLYLSHARRILAHVQDRNLVPDEHEAELRRRGGTNLAAALLMFFGWLALIIALFVVWDMAEESSRLGTRLSIGGGEVYYPGPAMQPEAVQLGNMLLADGYFDGRPKTVVLRREGNTVQVMFVFKREFIHDPAAIGYFQGLRQRLVQTVFRGPVDILLVDENLKLLRVVPPE